MRRLYRLATHACARAPPSLQVRGLVNQHIESFNHFLENDLRNIVAANAVIRSESDPTFFFEYKCVYVGEPSFSQDMVTKRITPHECRLRDLTYAAPLYVDVRYKRGNSIVTRNKVVIGRIPIMLRSNKCVLHGLSRGELARQKECPYDPGGYFVIKGNEKVVLSQEQLSKNRIIIELDPQGEVSSSVTSSTHERKSRTVVGFKGDRIHLKHNSIGDDVPVVAVFKALGVESDQEIVACVGSEPEFQDMLSASFAEAYALGLSTSAAALDYIGMRVKNKRLAGSRASVSREDEAIHILESVVLSHLPQMDHNLQPKAVYLGHMVRRMLLTKMGGAGLDDKDYYGNKRLELAGQLISLLFEDLFKRFNSDLKRAADAVLGRPARAEAYDPIPSIRADTITSGMVQAMATGNWVLRRFKMERAGVTQQLSRLSYISSLGMMTRVTSQFEKTRKVSGPRALQPSQWGMLCPSDTPEGEACGLVKNLALLTHVTSDEPDAPVRRLAFDLGVEDVCMVSGEELNAGAYIVFLNGLILGVHRRPHEFADRLRALRRVGLLGEFVSVYVHESQGSLHIASDGGRVCRPLIIVDPVTHQPRITREHLRDVIDGVRDFNALLAENCVEYVDVSEENNCLIALNEAQIGLDTTHMEIDPMTILGAVAGLIPYPHHNQSPRNTYQCAMGKQAMGVIAQNQFERFDTVQYLMVYPQKPMVRTRVIDMIGFDQLPAGQNAIIAVMSYSGYDIEDAIVVNKASLDRGYARCWLMRKYSTSMRKYPNQTSDQIVGPPPAAATGDARWHRFAALDADGLPHVSMPVQPGQILVNKQCPVVTELQLDNPVASAEYKPAPVTYKAATDGIVDKVLVSSTASDPQLIKVLMRQTRRPELGDKFSSRHGQKGVCGLIVQQQDMPFNDEGICPDMIMNPHGFPSRMTVGKMIEMIGGKAGLCDGHRRYGTAFGGDKVQDISAALVDAGYSYGGKEVMTSGITGETMPAYVFFGPIYYQKLKHMVQDKMHARARGPRAALTRQPTEGRSRDGGLRLGEMERDSCLGYGASALLRERLMISSDEFTAWVCTGECGGLLGAEGWCTYCRTGKHMTPIQMPYACKLLFQELQAMNIVPRLKVSRNID